MKLVSDHDKIFMDDEGVLRIRHLIAYSKMLIRRIETRDVSISRPFDDFIMYDVVERKLVYADGESDDIWDSLTSPNSAIIRRMMTSTTKFCVKYGFLAFYARGQLWFYLKADKYMPKSFPIIPHRYASHFTTEPISVSVHANFTLAHQQKNVLILHFHGLWVPYKTCLLNISARYVIISAVAINEGCSILLCRKSDKTAVYHANIDCRITPTIRTYQLDYYESYIHTETEIGTMIDGELKVVNLYTNPFPEQIEFVW